METEKEVRYKIIDQLKLQEIIKNTEEVEEKNQTIDLVMGWKGFDSLNEYGFICRIRQKRNNVHLEIKKRISENEWQESKIPLDSFKRGYDFLKLLGMDAYLYINRKRQIRKYKDLLIFIDEVDMLGDFVEIEYQETKNEKEQIEEFLNTFNIEDEKQDLYGGIFKEKIESELKFKEEFNNKLNKFLKENK